MNRPAASTRLLVGAADARRGFAVHVEFPVKVGRAVAARGPDVAQGSLAFQVGQRVAESLVGPRADVAFGAFHKTVLARPVIAQHEQVVQRAAAKRCRVRDGAPPRQTFEAKNTAAIRNCKEISRGASSRGFMASMLPQVWSRRNREIFGNLLQNSEVRFSWVSRHTSLEPARIRDRVRGLPAGFWRRPGHQIPRRDDEAEFATGGKHPPASRDETPRSSALP